MKDIAEIKNEYMLVQYPFIAEKKEDTSIFRTEDGFEMRFSNVPDGMRVFSTYIEDGTTFLEIELAEEGCQIIGETRGISVFQTPGDFYVPVDAKTLEFYREMYQCFVGKKTEDLVELAERLEERFEDGKFPEYPIKNITRCQGFLEMTPEVVQYTTENVIHSVQVRDGEKVPDGFNEKNRMIFIEKYGIERYEMQDRILSMYFSKFQMGLTEEIVEYCQKKDVKMKRDYLRGCLALHGYHLQSGPWRWYWIAYGYDPRRDWNAYKYQRYILKSRKCFIYLYKYSDIIDEIEKNISWYVRKEYDPVDGFFTETLKIYIDYLEASGRFHNTSSEDHNDDTDSSENA